MESQDNDSFFSLNEIHADVRRALLASSDMNELARQFKALNSNTERVYFAYDILKTHCLLPKLVSVEKCDEKSEERRKYGNHVFAALKKDFTAMKHYNKSVAYAKSKTVLALAYGNRSAIYFQNKLYNECIQDINYALENEYPNHLIDKLNERKRRAEENISDTITESYYSEIPNITGPRNNIIECASDAIEIKNSDNMGRHIIATKDINPGDVIAVEKPYTTILLYDYYLTHCHNCLRPSFNLIPCFKCPLTLYCSEECREISWQRYHKYECSLLDTLHSIDTTKLQLIALRVVLCARNEIPNLASLNNSLDEESFKSENYKEINELITNVERRSVNDLFARSIVAAVLLNLLETTSFFDETLNAENLKNCSADLLLKHLMTAPSNMHQISELQGQKDCMYDNVEIGAGAYAFMSLLNHSCAPNVVRHCHGVSMVLRAIRPIKIGQQLFDNYGYHHALMERDERKQHLKEQYLFTCDCEACIDDWPMYANISKENTNFVVDEDQLTALQNGSREMAEKLMPVLIINAKEFEESEPKKHVEILDNQEILKQCFALIGNKFNMF